MPMILCRRRLASRLAFALLLGIGFLAVSAALEAQSLVGSRVSLERQNEVAREHGFVLLRTPADVFDFVQRGILVGVDGNSDYELSDEVSYPYARPEVKTFVERLGQEYRARCGERLVVTSLTRPITRQPRNASEISVHPTGMALDLRRSDRSSCRSWLEKTLLGLEGQGLVEATREHFPPHYHVTVFPSPYLQNLDDGTSASAQAVARRAVLRRGDSARRHAVAAVSHKRSRAHHHRSVTQVRRASTTRTNRQRANQLPAVAKAR
jgi:uncharacterized protein DUF5715